MAVSSWRQPSQLSKLEKSVLQLFNLHKTNYHLKRQNKALNLLVTYIGILYVALDLSR